MALGTKTPKEKSRRIKEAATLDLEPTEKLLLTALLNTPPVTPNRRTHTGEKSKTILLIDADFHESSITSTVLKNAGHRVLITENGDIGFSRAIFAKPDAIILDTVMPGTDGYDVCRKLKSNHRTKGIPVLIKTGSNEWESIVRAYESGADDYLVKPCNQNMLVNAVADCLRISPLEMARRKLSELQNA